MVYISNTGVPDPIENNDPVSLEYLNNQTDINNGIASLDGLGKIPIDQFPYTGLIYRGTWNASINYPLIIDNSGNTSDYYIVNVDGSSNIQGETNWNIGDWIIFTTVSNGWEKIHNKIIGPKGDKGLKGDQGPKGETGEKGETGNKGEKGATGDIGIQGIIGIQGTTGDIGDQGFQGTTGEVGATGDQGMFGIIGFNGMMGMTGDKGDQGINGDKGVKGETGDKGVKGMVGNTGENGDKGDQGPSGDKGIKGEIGNKGVNGNDGIKGLKGDIGIVGSKGITGIKGNKGTKGDKGTKGINGIPGTKGDVGPLPELITELELITEYSVANPGLTHPENARYIEFMLVGGGAGGYGEGGNIPVQLGQTVLGVANNIGFGQATSINDSGNIIASSDRFNGGRTYVYKYNSVGSTWTQLGSSILATGVNDNFGFSMSFNSAGNILAIGAPSVFTNNGYVRIYQYNGSLWSLLGSTIYGLGDTGYSVSIDSVGHTVAIGKPDNVGSVSIYNYNGSNWTQLGQTIDGPTTGSRFGNVISINSTGTIVAIGADTANIIEIYQYNGSAWVQMGQTLADLAFGDAVSLNSIGDIVAIGAPSASSSNLDGNVYIYKYNGSQWVLLGPVIYEVFRKFGFSVSIDSIGKTVVIGTTWESFNGTLSGGVIMYKYDGANWTQIGSSINGLGSNDQLGHSTSINASGNIVISSSEEDARGYIIVSDFNYGGGGAGQTKKIKRKLPGNFSFTIGDGGDPFNLGNNTVLTTDTGTITALGGYESRKNITDGAPGENSESGQSGAGGNGGSTQTSGIPGFVRVTYS
jgi:hypothetical protein